MNLKHITTARAMPGTQRSRASAILRDAATRPLRRLAILPFVVLALAGATSAQATYKLTVTKPIAGHVYHPGEPILVEAQAPMGVTPQFWQVKWDITCTSCGNPPTSASVFTQANFLSPPGGYDVTNVLGYNYSYCVRVIMYPDQPGWDWSDKVCFTTSDNTLRLPDPHKLTKPPVFTKDPGPLNPGSINPGALKPQTNGIK